MSIFRKKNNQGQTLMETILAIGLLTTVVIGCLGLGIYSVRIGRFSQNQLIAANLAREGLEYVRNVRDTNWLKGQAWDTNLSGCATSNWCTLSFNAAGNTWTKTALGAGVTVDTCASDACELKIDPAYYTYYLTSGGTTSGFRRVFQINPYGSNKQVEVKVKWFENNQVKYLTLDEILTDWRP